MRLANLLLALAAFCLASLPLVAAASPVLESAPTLYAAQVPMERDHVIEALIEAEPDRLKWLDAQTAIFRGTTTPKSLEKQLSKFIPAFPRGTGDPVVMTVSIQTLGTKTRISVLRHGQRAPSGDTLHDRIFGHPAPDDVDVALDTSGADGAFIYSTSGTVAGMAETMATRLHAIGYRLGQSADSEGHLILAEAADRAAFIFIKPNETVPGRVTVVLRQMEI